MDAHTLIDKLELEPHVEGGYFRRSYQHTHRTDSHGDSTRALMSSIYYLLTKDSPVGHWHRNQSDIMHYWHTGAAITYYTISPEGEWQQSVLGPALDRGQQFQLLVPGGYWKASSLDDADYGLLSEAVCPGFDYRDMTLADPDAMKQQFPQHWSKIKPYLKVST